MTPEIKQRIEQIRRGEVPDGYKKTKAGVIPEDWEVKKLKTICDVNPVRSNNIVDKVVFLGMSDVSEDGKILNQEIVDYESVKKGFTPFQKGDILVAKITPCFENGKGAYAEALMTDIGFGSTEFHVLRCKNNAKFIFFHTTYPIFRKKMESEMTGSAGQKRVQTESIANYIIPFPPLPEQQKIADILTTQDRVIELKQQLLAQKQQQKKYLMQQLLTGKKRLPGFSGEWKKESLGNIAVRHIRRNTIGNSNVLTISAHYGLINQSEFFNKAIASDDKSDYYLLEKGDFAYNKSYSSGYPFGAIKRLTRYDVGIVSPLYICFKISKENVSGEFLDQYFEVGLLNHEIQAIAQEGARNHGLLNIAIDDFFNSKILLPPLKEQTAIANVLSAADREIDLIRQNIEQEKQKKKALMQLLLTGIVRVTV